MHKPLLVIHLPTIPFALQLRYANNSNYKNDSLIQKECFVGQAVIEEVKRIIKESEVRVA